MPPKLKSGERILEITVPQLYGGRLYLGAPSHDHDRQMVVDYRSLTNAPFAPPDLASLAKGLKFIRDKDHPIRDRLSTRIGAPNGPAEVQK